MSNYYVINRKPTRIPGSDNYNNLTNKPKINNIELTGNKTATDLSLASTTDLQGKVDKIAGKGLSTNDYTDAEKDKVATIDTIESDITEIKSKIPNQASSTNQLGDKNFINSSIATNTAYFRGTFNSVAELEAYSGEKTLNDYAFVVVYDPIEPTEVKQYNRYKYNGTAWVFEFTLNNSTFTSQQWASINSGITSTLANSIENKVDKITGKGLSTNDYTTAEKNKLGSYGQMSMEVTYSDDTTEIFNMVVIS